MIGPLTSVATIGLASCLRPSAKAHCAARRTLKTSLSPFRSEERKENRFLELSSLRNLSYLLSLWLAEKQYIFVWALIWAIIGPLKASTCYKYVLAIDILVIIDGLCGRGPRSEHRNQLLGVNNALNNTKIRM